MEFHILGPLEVIGRDGSLLSVGGGRERALLALLLTSPNVALTAEALIADLWGVRAPEASAHALQVHVSRLRKALREFGSDAEILTQSRGYLLRIDPRTIDAVQFDSLLVRARELVSFQQPEAAAKTFRDALALWRGPALYEVADGTVAGAEAARLEQAHLGAIEDRIEADMLRGLHSDVVSELDHLTRAHPFRERLWSLRLLALYRAGRQVEALRTYQGLRRILAGELGLEPSAELVRLDLAIARRDPSLDVVPAANTALPSRGDARRHVAHDPPDTRYATTDGVKIGYQVVGEGPEDVVLVPGFISNVDLYWDTPGWRQIFDRLSGLCRLILWDKRGTGVSDPVQRVPTLDERADDLAAVMDASHSTQATLFGISEGGALSLLFAATRPKRVRSLVLYGATPRCTASDNWPWGWSTSQTRLILEEVVQQWGAGALLGLFAPTEVDNPLVRRGWARTQRAGASPAMGLALMEAMIATDCREVLSSVTVPTLVLHRRGDAVAHSAAGRYISEQIPGSRFVEFPGDDHLITVGDLEPILVEIENFLSGPGTQNANNCALATVLCIDIAASDPAAPDLSAESICCAHELIRGQLDRYGGHEINVSETRSFATFVAPSRAIACAHSIEHASAAAGVAFRSGVHTGECERGGNDITDVAFRIAAAVSAIGSAGQVLATGTVKDLVAGSDLVFDSVGSHQLSGIPGAWAVFIVAP